MQIPKHLAMTVLLGALLVLFIGNPIAARFNLLGLRYLLDLVFTVVLFAALTAEEGRLRWKHPSVYAVILAVLLRFIGTAWHGTLESPGYLTFLVLSEVYIAVLVFHICIVLLKQAIRRTRITFNMVSGVAAVYVLMALAFASLHIVIFLLEGANAYAGSGLLWDQAERVDSVLQNLAPTFTYYSVVTQTTLGFGDISPTSQIARGLTIVQTLIGQLFLAVILARIVAMQLAQDQRDDKGG